MKLIKQYLPWITTAVLIILLFFKSCGSNPVVPNPRVQVKVVTDTVYTTKYIKIPEIKQIFVTKKPKPVDISIIAKDTFRIYDTKYTDSTGVAEIIVKDSIKGHLLNQVVSFKVKERTIEYKEKTITNTITIKQKPKFNLALGLNTAIGKDANIGAEATIKNGNGWSLDLGYNTSNQILIGIKRDIITLYDK